MNDPDAVVSPGGVGFDINCGVRLVRTNLDEKDVAPRKEQIAQVSCAILDNIVDSYEQSCPTGLFSNFYHFIFSFSLYLIIFLSVLAQKELYQ